MAQFYDMDFMSGQLRPGDQYSTMFTQEQLAVLQDAFQRNMSPEEQEIKELASRLQIKHQELQMWFHCQRDQLQTQERNHQTSSSLSALGQGKAVKRTSSKQASREMGASSNQATRGRRKSSNQGTSETGASSNQVTGEVGVPSHQAKSETGTPSTQVTRKVRVPSNQATLDVGSTFSKAKQRKKIPSKQATLEMSASFNQATVDMGASSKHATLKMVASSNQATLGMSASFNQTTVEVGASSNQSPLEMWAPFKQATLEMGISSSEATREMGASCNQAKRVREPKSSLASRKMGAPFNQPKPVRGAPCKQAKSLKDDEIFTPKADYAQLLSSRGSENSNLESQQNCGAKPPEGAVASAGNDLEDSELLELYHTCLSHGQPPWASLPYDIDTLVKMYALPGDDDPTSFDKYFPGSHD